MIIENISIVRLRKIYAIFHNLNLLQFMIDALKPEYVTPLVCYMVHDSFKDSGKLFEAGAQWYGTRELFVIF